MSREAQWDMINEWEEQAVVISTISEYDMEKGKVRHSPFRIKILPNAYLNEAYNTSHLASSSNA